MQFRRSVTHVAGHFCYLCPRSFMHPSRRRTIHKLLALVRRVRVDPSDTNALLQLQVSAADAIRRCERAKRRLRLQRRETKRAVATRREGSAGSQLTEALRRRLLQIDQLSEQNDEMRHVVRAVVDAVVFIYLSKWDIKPLAFRESAGFLAGKKGARLEWQVLRRALRDGHPAILNDLTLSLRYGDITVPGGRGALILELKDTSHTTARSHRQAAALSKMQAYLETDRTSDLYDLAGPMVRTATDVEEADHRAAVNDMIRTAKTGPALWRRVEPGLWFGAIWAEGKLMDSAPLGECIGRPIACIVNQFKWEERAYVPFTLSFTDPDAVTAFYSGELVVGAVLDTGVLTEHLAQRGVGVAYDFSSPRPITLFKEEWRIGGSPAISVGDHLFHRIFAEFASLKWFCELNADESGRSFRAFLESASEAS